MPGGNRRAPKPVGIPKQAPTDYERALRRELVDPVIKRMRAALREFASASEVGLTPDLEAVRLRLEASFRAGAGELDSVATRLAQGHVGRIAVWHRRRFLATMREFGLDLRAAMREPEVIAALNARVRDNVQLVRTIPQRMHASLERRLTRLVSGEQRATGLAGLYRNEQRFDPKPLEKLLRAEYRSTGYNLRRLTRDQTTKQIGQLTQIRQTQSGFTRYRWITAGDSRVRESHEANDGQLFAWSDPPPGTGHPGTDIQCRCQAAPHVERAAIERAVAAVRAGG